MPKETTGIIKRQILATGHAKILLEHEHFVLTEWNKKTGTKYTIDTWMHGKAGMANNYPWSMRLTKEQAERFCEAPEEALHFLKQNHNWYREHLASTP